jgi:CheY-like chemotaxis protein/anti-sigma regulatory factor (Ser/Thr protein kinase)
MEMPLGGKPYRLLIVDDSTVDGRLAGKILERELPVAIEFAQDGIQALERMAALAPDLVLTDLQMPRMDGLTLTARVRASYPSVPVVLMTAHGSEEIALAALQQGAASYVPKRHLARDLVATVHSLLSACGAESQYRRALNAWVQTEFRFCLENDASLIAGLVDNIQQYIREMSGVDEVDLIRIGVALHEALGNSIYHGNLELESLLRDEDSDRFYQLAQERRSIEPYCRRRVQVVVRESRHEGRYVIRDEGRGFDPTSVAYDPTNAGHLERPYGRGLFLIRMFMHEVRFNDRGNEITMIHRREPPDRRSLTC